MVHLWKNLLVRLGSVLDELQMVGTFRCCLLHEVVPYYSDQLSRRVVLGYRYLELACCSSLQIPGVAFIVPPSVEKRRSWIIPPVLHGVAVPRHAVPSVEGISSFLGASTSERDMGTMVVLSNLQRKRSVESCMEPKCLCVEVSGVMVGNVAGLRLCLWTVMLQDMLFFQLSVSSLVNALVPLPAKGDGGYSPFLLRLSKTCGAAEEALQLAMVPSWSGE